MAKKLFLRLALRVSLTLHFVAYFFLTITRAPVLRYDLRRCLAVVDKFGSAVPNTFVAALVTAEDHRNAFHPGVDPIGIARSFVTRISTGKTSGASTIEQQFVRSVTGKRQRTIVRKWNEQILAIAVCRHRSKRNIASAYLSTAFYGSEYTGLAGLRKSFGLDLQKANYKDALIFVAQLKYPRPLNPSSSWHRKVDARIEALLAREI